MNRRCGSPAAVTTRPCPPSSDVPLTDPTTWSTHMTTNPATNPTSDHTAALRETLRDLVLDGTLTPAQATRLWPADAYQHSARVAAALVDDTPTAPQPTAVNDTDGW